MRKEMERTADEILKVGQEEAAPTWRGLLESVRYTLEDWRSSGYSREEANDLIYEAVDTAVPVYQSQQFDLLDDPEAWNKVAFYECQLEPERTVVAVLDSAIHESLLEEAYAVLNEVYEAGEEEEI